MTMKFTDEQRRAIAADRRPQVIVAEAYGCSPSYIRTLRQRLRNVGEWKGARGPTIRQAVVLRKPLPDRFYRVDWDAAP